MDTAAEVEKPQTTSRNGIVFRITSSIDYAMRHIFFRIGFFVASHPVKIIILSFLITAVALLGMLRFRTESRAEKLWIPQSTTAIHNQRFVLSNFGRSNKFTNILFVAKPGKSLAERQAFLDMLSITERGFHVSVGPLDDENSIGTEITFSRVCRNTTDTKGNRLCRFNSAFNIFYKARDPDRRKQGQRRRVSFFDNVRRNIERLNNTKIKARLSKSNPLSYDGFPLNVKEIISGQSGEGPSFNFKAMHYTQIVNNSAKFVGGDLVDVDVDALEEKWTNTLLKNSKRNPQFDYFLDSSWSQNEAFTEAISSDLMRIAVGFVFLSTYTILFLGDFHVVRSHMLLGVCAIITTGLALATCFGISSLVGMFYGPVHQILPLFIMGIGLDDCFHITRAIDDFNRLPRAKGKSIQMRIALSLSSSGSSITVTSFTNLAVFCFSSITKLPALRYFSLWAAIGIFFAWFFSITFFTAIASLDLRRQDAKRRDCFPCFKPLEEVKILNYFKKPAGGFSRFFGNTFGPFIMRPIIRVIIIALFIAGFCASCYGTSQLYIKFKFSFFYAPGSPQRLYQDALDQYFKLGIRTNIYIRNRDLSTPENQERMLQLCSPKNGVIAKNEWIQDSTVDCWYSALRKEEGLSDDEPFVPINQSRFVQKLKSFFKSDAGGRFKNHILFNENKTQIVGSKFRAQYKYTDTNDDEIQAMNSVREAADSVGFGDEDGKPAAFPYVFRDTFTEQYNSLPTEMAVSLSLAALAVAIVCVILVGHPSVAFVCLLSVGSIIIGVLGLTYFSDVNLSSVSVITLVICTGISVDFVVHIARSFLEQIGTRSERAIKSLEVMGPPVFYAGFSTLLAVSILSTAQSYVFRVLFKGFLFLITLGFLHGLILGPVVLSFIGPSSFYQDEGDKERAEMDLEAVFANPKILEDIPLDDSDPTLSVDDEPSREMEVHL